MFEETHYATSPREKAICGDGARHPFGATTEPAMVDCKMCRALYRLAEVLFEANDNSLGARFDGESADLRARYIGEASRVIVGLELVPK